MLGQPERMLPHPRLGIVQATEDQRGVESMKAVQRVQRMKAAERRLRLGNQFSQRRDGSSILPRVEQPGCRVAMPAVGVVKQSNQFHSRRPAESRRLSWLDTVRNDALYAALVDPCGHVHVLEDLRRQECCALDQLTAHVYNVECPIRSVGELHRSEPIVFRSEELFVFIGAVSDEAGAVRLQTGAEDKIVGDLADEDVPAILGWPRVAAIDGDAGRSCEEAGWLAALVGAGDDAFISQ